MLQIIERMNKLPFSELMEIYIEGNEEKAEAYGDGGLLRAEQEFDDYLRNDFFRIPSAIYCLWRESGKAVSALRLEPYQDGWLLEALETAPAYRKRGYATALVKSVREYLGEEILYSHVSKMNEASLRTHFSCGFEVWKDYAVYLDGSVSQRAVTLRSARK